MAVGGFLGATEATHDVAEVEYIKSPLVTALAIFIVAALIFGSPLVAAILTSTLLVTLFGQYGLGAYYTSVENWSGNLHFATLVSLSIAMGLGVDYGIYMISRLKEEMAATGGKWVESLQNTPISGKIEPLQPLFKYQSMPTTIKNEIANNHHFCTKSYSI